MNQRCKSRREWLGVTLPGMLGLPLVGLPLVGLALGTSGCSKAEAFSCTGTTGLAPSDMELRLKVAYVDKAPNPEQVCAHCTHYLPAREHGCGGCNVMPGPTHPNGYCKVFQAKS